MRILAILAGSVVISVLLFLTRPESHAGLKPVAPQYVETVAVIQTDIQTTVTIAGRLQPVRTASLPFEVAGQVVERRIEPGQAVSQGDVLLVINSGDYEDAVAENKAMLALENSAIERDKTMLALAQKERDIMQRELERMAMLEQKSLASQSRFEETQQKLLSQQEHEAALQHSVDTALARRARLQASLNRAGRNLDRTQLVAPFSGVINSVSVEVGDYVNQGQRVVELLQVEELDVYLEVSGEIASLLVLQQSVLIKNDKQSYTGVIVAVSPDPDPSTNTHAVRIRLSAQELYPGAIVKVELPGAFYAAAKVIPASALLRESGQDYVYAVNDNNLKRIPVSLLASLPDQYIIEGVSVGTVIAARDVAAFRDGQEVSMAAP